MNETELHQQPSCDNVPLTGMSEHDSHWTAKAKWMRDTGATDAAWSTDGALVHLRLGAAPPSPSDDDHPAKQNPLMTEQLERERRRELAARTSGGPVRRVSEDQ